MTDRPIIFSAPMVRALLEGRKTQTRRVLRPQPWSNVHPMSVSTIGDADAWDAVRIPYAIGDRLYVREAFSITNDGCYPSWLRYRADPEGTRGIPCNPGRAYGSRISWKPSIHMPRWASRLTLIVTDVRVHRLQEISEADAMAEGCGGYVSADGEDGVSPREQFQDLWNSLHGPDAWAANHWVAALTFRVIRANIDIPEAANEQ